MQKLANRLWVDLPHREQADEFDPARLSIRHRGIVAYAQKNDTPPAIIFDPQDRFCLSRRPNSGMRRRIFVRWLNQKVVRASRQIADLTHVDDRPPEVKEERLIIGVDRVERFLRRDGGIELCGDGADFLTALG